ncbi:CBS domain-containing protein [Pseudomonas entomophila]|uniref:CBS domain-containing protein n=1 Tax=Pseudomonas entomophila TaxID=312306 RepID=UPI0023D7BE6B|nr:CBS domain-containing protein [Pseudomonas entomophila]MDF0732322.1 CBS domain-containing protein [Pseudomonas entomophila]
MYVVNFHRVMGEIRRSLDEGIEPEPIPVRALISWIGSTRRGTRVVYQIRSYLNKHNIGTHPDFESVPLDATIKFYKKPEQSIPAISEKNTEQTVTLESTFAVEIQSTMDAEVIISRELVSGAAAEPAFRVSRLPAANVKLISVKPDETLSHAITLMLRHDYAQLPVMTTERDVKGVISWESIGPKLALTQERSIYVRDYMKPHNEIKSSDSIFFAIPRIVENNYVLVRSEDRTITGIITTADLSMQFKQLSEPFLLLSEIENHIRKLIDDKFTKDELTSSADPNMSDREIETVADLTFGEYIRLFQQPILWEKTGIKVDRKIFVDELDKVRIIRNDVMHFDPDGISDEDHILLHHFVRFIHQIQSLTA